jgi:solute carrier family 25 carnitine/acylcarnitine transporter 20/29
MYEGIRCVFKQLMKEEGPRGLYRGWLPVMMRAFPANACCFLGYEATMKLLNDTFQEGQDEKI